MSAAFGRRKTDACTAKSASIATATILPRVQLTRKTWNASIAVNVAIISVIVQRIATAADNIIRAGGAFAVMSAKALGIAHKIAFMQGASGATITTGAGIVLTCFPPAEDSCFTVARANAQTEKVK